MSSCCFHREVEIILILSKVAAMEIIDQNNVKIVLSF
jgi:hypothetical protein